MSKKIILVILTIILILAGVGVGVYLVQQSAEIREKAAPSTTMSLTTNNPSPQLGQNVTVDVNINTGENRITGAEMYINFDASRLEVLEVSQGPFFTNAQAIGPTIDNNAGSIYYVLYLPTQTTKQGQGIVATVTFKTKLAGSVTVSIGPNTVIGAFEESAGGGPYDRLNVLIGTTPVTINIQGVSAASPTPTQVQTTTTLTPTLTPTSVPGVGGNDNTPTLTPTKTPTPTQGQSTSSQSVSPTPTPELPPIPDSGISLPTFMGITLGVLVIVGSLLLAL